MNRFILVLAIITGLTGIVGFNFDTPLTTLLRITFLIAADILVILLLAKLFFAGNRLARRSVKKSSIETTQVR
ncbi:hypothetical protein [Nonlabens xiamenensis]|uniref:hypothetical protein n=1 Tax=Nonlabens xiamenensis TaxID=2341043 RepID=UPI000F60F54F|nr:hypothetical protein [Nonlabens xiamenensis]